MDNRPIGLLDSGVGGLTVVKEVLRQLPNESTVFIGDQARLPYGTRQPEQIVRFTRQLVHFLQAQNVKMIVIACNTATATALPILKQELNIPIIGVIDSGSRAAVQVNKNQKIAVIATPATIKAHAYQQALLKLAPTAQIKGLATPEFVTMVERNQYQSSSSQEIVTQILQPLRTFSMDTLILGCTHFPLLGPLIQQAVGSNVHLIDAGAAAVQAVHTQLQQLNLAAVQPELIQHQYYTTGDPRQFEEIANDWLAPQHIHARHIDVEELKS